jgi:hypothetical protein
VGIILKLRINFSYIIAAYVRLQTPYHKYEDQEEISKIVSRLDQDESVEIVAKQSKYKPGGSAVTPNTIFVTNKRVIIRNPTMLGAREKVDAIAFNQITSIQLGEGVFSSTIKLRAYGYQEDIEAIPIPYTFISNQMLH